MWKYLAAILLTGCVAMGAGNTTYRDASGRVSGRSTTSGSRTTYRDASGKISGSAATSGSRTT